jgi:hypothetical protein
MNNESDEYFLSVSSLRYLKLMLENVSILNVRWVSKATWWNYFTLSREFSANFTLFWLVIESYGGCNVHLAERCSCSNPSTVLTCSKCLNVQAIQ